MAGIVATACLGIGSCGGDGSDAFPAPPSARVLVAVGLDRDSSGLNAFVERLAATKSPHFIDIGTVAARFGATAATTRAAIHAFAKLGVKLRPDPTRGLIWGQTTVKRAESVFGTDLVITGTGEGRRIQPAQTPSAPASVASVDEVVGLRGSYPQEPRSHVDSDHRGPGLPPCPPDATSRSELATLYGVGPLIERGADGDGVSIDVLEDADFQAAASSDTGASGCAVGELASRPVHERSTPLLDPTPSDSEVSLDVPVIRLLTPKAKLEIARYNRDSSLIFGLIESFRPGTGQNATPDILVSALGFCEGDLETDETGLGEWLLAALAATGTTTVVATGDTGSSGCYPETADPAVIYPASSAYVTAVGGADFDGSADDPEGLTVWDNADAGEAGGGGVSSTIEAPQWQSAVAQDGHRVLPDLSAYAGDDAGEVPVCSPAACEWTGLDGTSLATVGFAAELALATGGSRPQARSGNLAPALQADGSDHRALTDVVEGDNELHTSQCCRAGEGFDLASGWGLPNPERLPVRQRAR